MDKTKWYKNPEMIVALSALVIGIVTAFTSIYSAYIDREYARASVWPRIELYRSYSGESFSYGVSNSGTGPAIIHHVTVKQGDSPIKVWKDIAAFADITQSYLTNRTLPAQSNITPLLYNGDKIQEVLKADKAITIELCYCSIYAECWVVDRINQPQPITNCEIDEKLKFLQ